MTALCLILAAMASPSCPDADSGKFPQGVTEGVTEGVTVEWLTQSSSLIFIGTRVKRSVTRSDAGSWVTREQFQLDRVLEGALSKGDTATVNEVLQELPPESWWTDASSRLIFAETVRRPEWKGQAKYSVIDRESVSFSFVVGEDDSLSDYRLFTPEFRPLLKYSELEGRVHRHLAWKDQLQTGHGAVDFKFTHLYPRDADLANGQGPIIMDSSVADRAGDGLLWPCPFDQERSAIIRWPSARLRAPARIQPLGTEIEFNRLDEGQRAFSNRGYTWFSVPTKLRGWSYSVNEGGESHPVRATVAVSGHVYLAIAQRETSAVEAAGWTLASDDGDLDFRYNDRGHTRMKVYSRHMDAGATVEFPAAIWTGSVILIPPAWL